ncbi:MAG TPA: hypothetical protein VIE66_17495 [Methylocella sp.]|jgi:hypothetical protein
MLRRDVDQTLAAGGPNGWEPRFDNPGTVCSKSLCRGKQNLFRGLPPDESLGSECFLDCKKFTWPKWQRNPDTPMLMVEAGGLSLKFCHCSINQCPLQSDLGFEKWVFWP